MKSVVKYMIGLLMVSPLVAAMQIEHTDLMKTVGKRSNGVLETKKSFEDNTQEVNTLVWDTQDGIYKTALDVAAKRKTKDVYDFLSHHGALTGAQLMGENVTNCQGPVLNLRK